MSAGTLLPPFGLNSDNSSGHVVLPLGDVQAGDYTTQTASDKLAGVAGNIAIYDSDGANFSQASIGRNGDNSLTFTLHQDGTGLGAVVSPQSPISGNISVNFNFTGNLFSRINGSSPAPNHPNLVLFFGAFIGPVLPLVWL
ncbi:uncharacterized protein EI90DRAFT_3131934 [Cantharellus anzutake]|uniref:uncharacterized protein n=1 Tax=Cantharellus anzutake TaxID=1750568 RepID=UPI0019060A33|nr:uncharacterized protein EI90DRAFT_3131934 [Cantharellus anzutake]KAF8320557.1 hypothetical protein EI90DRAFT_3131934 [Cantharellus anzutake]